ncbi:unnamed protein product [Nyctereutes procyonoides]|uniref:(raccoon dog) hypothetical protein n=1 Tax=Nyctereutes procyonoides TaxID=34880 RepID=A0A811YB51_NYCPR|nr:unnamed protein product [Nyctereutes procyonoides]
MAGDCRPGERSAAPLSCTRAQGLPPAPAPGNPPLRAARPPPGALPPAPSPRRPPPRPPPPGAPGHAPATPPAPAPAPRDASGHAPATPRPRPRGPECPKDVTSL